MRVERGFAIGVAIVLLLTLAVPAGAHHERDRREIEVSGVIVALDARDGSFVLHELRRRGGDHIWVVQLHPRVRIEFARHDDDDDDDESGEKHHDWDRQSRTGFRHLRIGHMIDVEGRLIADGHIQARKITILRLARKLPPTVSIEPPVGRRPFPRPGPVFSQAPQILLPQDGAEIATAEFTVIGRTLPRAQVHIEVTTLWLIFTLPGSSADVVADDSGFFASTIRPAFRLPGAAYRITVTASIQGVALSPSSITVHQR
jgi:hypothetical protein